MMTKKLIYSIAALSLGAFLLGGCKETYSEGKMAQELIAICQNEYKISDVQVKFIGTTISVYLPVKKLFNTNLKDALVASKMQNLEALLQPSQEALEQVENVLFSTSRVVLSSDKKIDFYTLQATDVDTGIQLSLTGYVEDIKRVRLWDISRNEYRKRVYHDLRIDRTAVWYKMIKDMLEEIGTQPAEVVTQKYFAPDATEEIISPTFHTALLDSNHKKNITYNFLDVRSQVSRDGEGLLYVKFKENYEPNRPGENYSFLYPSGTTLEYIFVLHGGGNKVQHMIDHVIPFYYVDENKVFTRSTYPDEIKFEDHLNEWQSLFDAQEVELGSFLAGQITRRVEAVVGSDERIFNTFNAVKVAVKYSRNNENKKPFFGIGFTIELKDASIHLSEGDWASQEDVVYLLDLVLREFTTVLRGYHFDDYVYFEISNTANPSSIQVGKSDLELFRKGKINIVTLLHPAIAAGSLT